jgi:S-adenosylmethionine hydrolase
MDSAPGPEKARLVAILTDFGLSDAYVGEMKGVLAALAPSSRVVDLTHGITPGAVREGAWVLAKSLPFFPPGSVYLAVVDPGVGGQRSGLAAAAGGRLFVGPDNGLLAPALAAAAGEGERPEVRSLDLREIDRPRRGSTFDGRDVFAPAAARLAAGLPLGEVGPELEGWESLTPFRPVPREDGWDLEIVRVDRFGNLVTVAEEAFLREELGEEWRSARVRVVGREVDGIRLAYEDVEPGQPLLTIGSAGTLELSLNRGSAAHELGLAAGTSVRLLRAAG